MPASRFCLSGKARALEVPGLPVVRPVHCGAGLWPFPAIDSAAGLPIGSKRSFMKTMFALNDITQQFGADRVLDAPGSLPQLAGRLDPSPPVRPFEFEVAVERLCLDSTSFRNLRERAGGDADVMAELIVEIVASRGKMQNPETESGGVLLGTVAAVGDRSESPPVVGERIATLAS